MKAGSNACGIGYFGGYVTPFKVTTPSPPTPAPSMPTLYPTPFPTGMTGKR